MPDWHAYVRARLAHPAASDAEREEMVNELAAHLEDTYTSWMADGLAEQDAIQRTCQQAGNWDMLSAEIEAIKREGEMQNRVTQLWVPGLVTLLSSAGLLALLGVAGVQPIVVRAGSPSGIVLYVPWLLALPILGALGAWLSRRAKASGLAVHVSSAFPAVVMVVVMVLLFIWALFIDQPVSVHLKTIGFAAAVVTWIALPGVALLLGDLAVALILSKHEAISR